MPTLLKRFLKNGFLPKTKSKSPTSIKLLLDENIGQQTAKLLKAKGHDVVSVADLNLIGAADEEIVTRSLAEQRIIVTLDRDFGYLVHRAHKKHAGILYLRLQQETPEHIAHVIHSHHAQLSKIPGHFARATENKIVIRS